MFGNGGKDQVQSGGLGPDLTELSAAVLVHCAFAGSAPLTNLTELTQLPQFFSQFFSQFHVVVMFPRVLALFGFFTQKLSRVPNRKWSSRHGSGLLLVWETLASPPEKVLLHWSRSSIWRDSLPCHRTRNSETMLMKNVIITGTR